MVGRLGLEPRTYWLKAKCSTIELTTHKMVLEAGIEPACPDGRGILSPLCLPIPPLKHVTNISPAASLVKAFVYLFCQENVMTA